MLSKIISGVESSAAICGNSGMDVVSFALKMQKGADPIWDLKRGQLQH